MIKIWNERPRVLLGAGLTVAGLLIAIAYLLTTGHAPSRAHVQSSPFAVIADDDTGAIRVSTIHPKKDPSFVIGIQQLALVKAYFQVDLKTRVAGMVRTVKTDIGDVVKKGDLLVEIDVPDLEKAVQQKRGVVEQRRQEMRLAEAKANNARALVEVAKTNIAQQKAGIVQAQATRDYRKKRLDRFRELLKRQAINEDLVDEQEKDWLAGEGAFEVAQALVAKAEADLKEKASNLEAAQVDVDLHKAEVEVARHDLEHAQAIADYAKITAPFDGVVTMRNISPGHFVQNASTGTTEPLLSLARIDIVTVVGKVPDNVAPFISKNTAVDIQVDQLPGMVLAGKVTRFSPSIETSDRTMRVEVDIANDKEIGKDDLRSGTEAALAASQMNGHRKLLPGMNGYMRLKLSEFANAYLVPASAVFTRGGKQYIMLADEGKARLVPVAVQVNDGKLAKIALLRRDASGRESVGELTGNEEIVASRQAELDDGQLVQANLKDW